MARGATEPSLQPGPHPSPVPALAPWLLFPLTPSAAKATRNPGVMIQQAQTRLVPCGSLPACWLPADVFIHF